MSRLTMVCAVLLLAGCAAQMETPAPHFGEALKAAKDAQRITPYDRDDGLRPQARELPAGVVAPAPAGMPASSPSWGQTSTGGGSGVLIMPAGR